MHAYERSPHSGAGNCHCGWPEHSRAHPHAYMQRWRSEKCVCSYAAQHPIHTDAATATPKPIPPTGLDAVHEAIRRARGGDAPVGVHGYA
jgi:hypothetical protein